MTMPWLLSAAIVFAGAAAAQTPAVDQARVSGAVGERFDGYLGVTGTASALVRSQVGTINIRRRALYSNLAARKGASAQDVGFTAGCQLLARLEAGQSYMLSDGVWRRLAAGQRAPVPAYCR